MRDRGASLRAGGPSGSAMVRTFPRGITATDVYTHSKHMIATIRREGDRQRSTDAGRMMSDPTERAAPAGRRYPCLPPPTGDTRHPYTYGDLRIHGLPRRGTGRTPPVRQRRDVGYQQRHIIAL